MSYIEIDRRQVRIEAASREPKPESWLARRRAARKARKLTINTQRLLIRQAVEDAIPLVFTDKHDRKVLSAHTDVLVEALSEIRGKKLAEPKTTEALAKYMHKKDADRRRKMEAKGKKPKSTKAHQQFERFDDLQPILIDVIRQGERSPYWKNVGKEHRVSKWLIWSELKSTRTGLRGTIADLEARRPDYEKNLKLDQDKHRQHVRWGYFGLGSLGALAASVAVARYTPPGTAEAFTNAMTSATAPAQQSQPQVIQNTAQVSADEAVDPGSAATLTIDTSNLDGAFAVFNSHRWAFGEGGYATARQHLQDEIGDYRHALSQAHHNEARAQGRVDAGDKAAKADLKQNHHEAERLQKAIDKDQKTLSHIPLPHDNDKLEIMTGIKWASILTAGKLGGPLAGRTPEQNAAMAMAISLLESQMTINTAAPLKNDVPAGPFQVRPSIFFGSTMSQLEKFLPPGQTGQSAAVQDLYDVRNAIIDDYGRRHHMTRGEILGDWQKRNAAFENASSKQQKVFADALKSRQPIYMNGEAAPLAAVLGGIAMQVDIAEARGFNAGIVAKYGLETAAYKLHLAGDGKSKQIDNAYQMLMNAGNAKQRLAAERKFASVTAGIKQPNRGLFMKTVEETDRHGKVKLVERSRSIEEFLANLRDTHIAKPVAAALKISEALVTPDVGQPVTISDHPGPRTARAPLLVKNAGNMIAFADENTPKKAYLASGAKAPVLAH